MRIRRETHKEVERRRREIINNGITELSKLVPGDEKNKGRILQRTIQYIRELKEAQAQIVEKSAMEKVLFEQTSNCLI